MDLDDRVLPTGADQGPKPGSGGLVREHVVDLGILPKENMVDKIKAIVEVRNALDPDFVVRARCYALDSNISIPEAVDAMIAYRDAGADVIYIGYPPRDVEQIRQMVKEIDAPCTCPAYFLSYEQAADIGLCEVTPSLLPPVRHVLGGVGLSDGLPAEGRAGHCRFHRKEQGQPIFGRQPVTGGWHEDRFHNLRWYDYPRLPWEYMTLSPG